MSADEFRVAFSAQRLEGLRAGVRGIVDRSRALQKQRAPIGEIAGACSDLTDQFLVETLEQALAGLPPEERKDLDGHFALVAVGGSGRRDPAPYSDVDLLFLLEKSATPLVQQWIAQVVRDYWDAGLKLGHSVRANGEVITAALDDIQFATSLIEARLLWGSGALFENMHRRFTRRVVRSRWKAFCRECIDGREEEREKHGGAVLSLVPDVKRSKGGLRDWHLIRWLTFAEFGDADLQSLVRAGLFTEEDCELLRESIDYLSAIRLELHLAAGKTQDVLTRPEQLRLAESFGFQATVGQRPVERFMQAYFRHSSRIARLCQRLITRHEYYSLTDRIVGYVASHRADHRFLVSWDGIDVLPKHREELLRDPEQMLRFYTLSALYGRLPKPDVVEDIRRTLPTVDFQMTDEVVRRFRRILKTSTLLGPVLRSLDEAGLLERIVPDFANAHCLLQFNQYHSYTVDEHTFRAVTGLTAFAHDPGPLGKAYRAIRHHDVVHLAMLLHDLGKGFEEDHCEVGKRIAERLGPRLGFTETQQEQLSLLVHKHLVMANTAFWRDISDPKVLMDFSREVGSVETLRMLYVLTAADVAAVGPGVWTDWKSELLTELYRRTLSILSGEGGTVVEEEIRREKKADILRHVLRDTSLDPVAHEAWLEREFETFPLHYLVETAPEVVADDLETVSQLQPGDVLIDARNHPETESVEYRVIVAPEFAAGCFHRIAGALTALRMGILTAQICTTTRGIVVDRFYVVDRDFEGEVPQYRIDEVAEKVQSVIRGERPVRDLFARRSRFTRHRETVPFAEQPTQLVIDNDSSERCTVIDVFTIDRPGLLYALAHAIFDAGLSVELAKIGTHMEQVVDVFYVTAESGGKLQDPERIAVLKEQLDAVLDTFENDDEPLADDP